MRNENHYVTIEHNPDSFIEVDLYSIARVMGLEQFAYLLDNFINIGFKDFKDGVKIGKLAQEFHRTLQGVLVRICLGILCGLSEQDERYLDARNSTAIMCCKKIKRMYDNGELDGGYLI